MGKRTKTSYSLEFKQSSARLAVESNQPVSKTAEELGINSVTLHGWINKFHPDFKRKNTTSPTAEQELKRVKKELARVKQERDILKKAAAYFASEMP